LPVPGVEVAVETVVASPYMSAVLNFASHPLAHLSRGAGSFAAEGLKKTIRYQLSAISFLLRLLAAHRERIYPFRLLKFCRHSNI